MKSLHIARHRASENTKPGGDFFYFLRNANSGVQKNILSTGSEGGGEMLRMSVMQKCGNVQMWKCANVEMC